MNSPVRYDSHDGVAILTVDNPPVNALSHAVRAGVVEHVTNAERSADIDAIVLICAGRTFFAGADITEFGKPPKSPSLRDMLEVIDACSKPTVAAIHGTALGGGLETALCCNYRLAVPTAKLGVPESALGLLPGAGGTQRLPRIVGAEKALDMMISAKPVGAADAERLGLVDRIVEEDALERSALEFAKQLRRGDDLPRASAGVVERPADGFFADYRKKIAGRTRGYEAPERIVRCVEAAVDKTFDEGMAFEREMFMECMASPQSAALRHLFFAERAAGKLPGLDGKAAVRPVTSVGVVGAGTMGAGIALACLDAGLDVVLTDNSAEGLLRGRETIASLLDRQVAKGRVSDDGKAERLSRLATDEGLGALESVDLVIEAAFESMKVKQEIFAELDSICRPGAILATNTSTLDIDKIAASTSRPEDVIGLHFFSPANVMRLLEIVRGAATSADVIASSLKFAKRIRKLGVVVGNCFGFVGNRMLYGYGRENQLLLLEGALPERIDRVLTDWGMAMGPNAVGDLAGLDVGYKVRQERTDLPDDPRFYRVANVLAEMGRYGQKTGAGMFRYDAGSRAPIPDPEVHAIIRAEAEKLGVRQREISDEEIVQRCIYALVMQGAEILDEGIAVRSGDIDAIWANGYGFPRYRGGPMFYADAVGLRTVLEDVTRLADQHGEAYWQAPELLRRLASDDRGFASMGAPEPPGS